MLRAARLLPVFALLGLGFLTLISLDVAQSADSVAQAILKMTWGLVLIWVVGGGLLMYAFRQPLTARIRRVPLGWRTRFVLLAVVLALLEEAVTVSMTNLAPAFGVPLGAAYITASADYLDVVLFHSVIVFVPMFVVWAWLLARYDFTPGAVLLLFGLTGTLAETISFGVQSLFNVGLWVFVYGLMIYLPAYSVPPGRGVRPPRFYHYPLALVLPLLATIPVVLVVGALHPVGIHFAPIP